MNKAVPWNINGVGFDARDAARLAARRQGKSLGEWLDGIIADHAAEQGLDLDDIDGQDRIDAVKSKLERLRERAPTGGNARRSSHRFSDQDAYDDAPGEADDDPRGSYNRNNISYKYRAPVRDYARHDGEYDDEPASLDDSRRHRTGRSNADFLLDDAIEAMERRTSRAERKSEKALSSISRMIESNGDRLDGDHEIFLALARKMAEMEARITNRVSGDQKPIKGALTRLEARLEAIGRRSRAGFLDGAENGVPGADDTSSARASSPAKARLNDAIADITRQQRILDEYAAPPQPGPRRPVTAPLAQDRAPLRDDDALAREQIRTQLAAIEAHLAYLNESGARKPVSNPVATPSSAGPVKDVRSLLQRPREPQFLDKIEQRLETLGTKIDHVQRQLDTSADALSTPAQTNTQTLENLIRTLSDRIETARAPGAGPNVIEDLQNQIEQLSRRFAESNSELAILPSLERSMKSLFAQMETTRKTIETTAARAAQEAAAAAMASGRREAGAPSPDTNALRSLQEKTDQNAQDTLGALHETLEKIVDRLSFMEDEIAGLRRPASQARADKPAFADKAPVEQARDEIIRPPVTAARRKPEPDTYRNRSPGHTAMPDLVLGEADIAATPVHAPAAQGQSPHSPMQGSHAAAPRMDTPRAPQAAQGRSDPNGRAEFIAAARRAARIAQGEPSVAALKEMAQTAKAPASSSELVEKSRHYLQTHKKPILMIMAALFVMAGTLAVIGGFQGGSALDSSGPKAPAKITAPAPRQAPAVMPGQNQIAPHASLEDPNGRGADPVQTSAAGLSPSALPRNPVPPPDRVAASDKTPTGSINAIPSFAAQEAARSKAETINAQLKQMAEAGNAAAAYELASRYAEGRELRRDLAQAATLFEQAAKAGFVPAQYKLGSLFEKGNGVARDAARARMWYARAANSGNPRAMHNLAVMIADGDGHPDYIGAVQWFRKAAEYGVHDSQYNLAILYARGLGVKQSLIQSYQWFAVAAAQDDADAAKKRDEVAAKLSADDLAVGKALAAAFHPKTPDPAALDPQIPSGGWDSISATSPVKNEKPKLSSL